MAVGIAVLTRGTRVVGYVAGVWLLGIAGNLIAAGFFDVAVRDVVMAIGAYTLAKLSEARAEARASAARHSVTVATLPEYSRS
jgi:hypothetical protein